MELRIALAALALGLAAGGASAEQAATAGADAEAPIRFELCGHVATVEIGEFAGPEPHAVLIQLDDAAERRFAELTRANPGRMLEITHAGHPLLRARTHGEVRSGLVNATYAKREDALGLRAALADASLCPPDAPAGAGGGS